MPRAHSIVPDDDEPEALEAAERDEPEEEIGAGSSTEASEAAESSPSPSSPNGSLSARESIMIDQYFLRGCRISPTARAMGLSRETIVRWLRRPHIRDEIERRRLELRRTIRQKLPLDTLLEIMNAPRPARKAGESAKQYELRVRWWQALRLKAATAAAPYVHPQLKAIEHRVRKEGEAPAKLVVEMVQVGPPSKPEPEPRAVPATPPAPVVDLVPSSRSAWSMSLGGAGDERHPHSDSGTV